MPTPIGCDQKMSVYMTDASGGYDDPPVATGVACRLAVVSRRNATTLTDRRALSAIRLLIWDPGVVVDPHAQIEVEGVMTDDGTAPARWNVQEGTLALLRGPDGSPHHRHADVAQSEAEPT